MSAFDRSIANLSRTRLFPCDFYDASTMRLWFGKSKARLSQAKPFLDSPAPLMDELIELVEPSVRWVEPYLMTTQSAACIGDVCSKLQRRDLLRFVDQFPRGRQAESEIGGLSHGYTFWVRLRQPREFEIAGTVSLRIGDDDNLRRYLGHIGYGVFPPTRGHRIAERATRLLFPLARAHGMSELWVTANPENIASRRTCEHLAGSMVDIVNLPTTHPLYLRGEVCKCRYRIDLRANLGTL